MAKNGKTYWLGFDLGGTKMLATLFDAKFRVVASERKKTKANNGMDDGLDRMEGAIDSVLEKGGILRKQLGGIGVGCPGPLDLDAGVILCAPNLGWKNVPVKATLEKAFGCPAVIANDVDAGTYGEYRFGAARGARCVLGVFPGTGIGGACIYEGNIFRGRTGSCMEIGHFPVDPVGPVTGPGVHGILESLASRLAISAQAAQAVYRGQAPALQRLAGTTLENIRSGVLAQAIAEGDTVVEEIVRHAAKTLGTTVAGVVNLLAPDVLVLGGGLVEAMPDLYVKTVKKTIDRRAMKAYASAVNVVAAQLGDNAGVMGAAAMAADHS